jgi:hypothetical protein
MHEIIDINPVTAFLFALVFIFGICALGSGLLMAVFGADRARSMGFLQMIFGWIALFVLYLFLWNREFLVTMIAVLIGGIIGIIIAVGLLLFLAMRS